MKNHELRPTRENLLSTFEIDAIGRNKDVMRFCNIISHLDYSASIALDGRWGSGKTFYIKQAKMFLDSINDNNSEYTDAEKERINRGFRVGCKRELDGATFEPQVCVYYDAWENDNDEDPILSLVYQICGQIQNEYNFTTDNHFSDKAANLFLMAAKIAEKLTPQGKLESILGGVLNISDASKDAIKALFQKDSTLLDEVIWAKNVEQTVKSFLEMLLPEKGNRLVIFIDELDRCKPTYAVKLLERVKHYLDNDRITVIFSVNLFELQHTIRSYYGAEFDADRYLDRFFDLRLSIPQIDRTKYFMDEQFHYSNDLIRDISIAVADELQMEMREMARFFNALSMTTNRIRQEHVYPLHSYDTLYMISIFVPILLGLKATNSSLYNDFVSGRNGSILFPVSRRLSTGYFDFLLNRDEANTRLEGNQLRELLEERLLSFYNAIFSANNKEMTHITIGSQHIEKGDKVKLLNIAALQHNLIDFT